MMSEEKEIVGYAVRKGNCMRFATKAEADSVVAKFGGRVVRIVRRKRHVAEGAAIETIARLHGELAEAMRRADAWKARCEVTRDDAAKFAADKRQLELRVDDLSRERDRERAIANEAIAKKHDLEKECERLRGVVQNHAAVANLEEVGRILKIKKDEHVVDAAKRVMADVEDAGRVLQADFFGSLGAAAKEAVEGHARDAREKQELRSELEKVSRNRVHAARQLDALRWQVEHHGCAVAHMGETTFECDATSPCGLCRLRHERDKAASDERKAVIAMLRSEAVRARNRMHAATADCLEQVARDVEARGTK